MSEEEMYEKALVSRDNCKTMAEQCRIAKRYNEAEDWEQKSDDYQRQVTTFKLIKQVEAKWKGE